jgi:hypothetical protein
MGRIDGRDRVQERGPREGRLGATRPAGIQEQSMTAGTEPLTERPAWKTLKAPYDRVRDLHL